VKELVYDFEAAIEQSSLSSALLPVHNPANRPCGDKPAHPTSVFVTRQERLKRSRIVNATTTGFGRIAAGFSR
jgi:hypothetical protein